MKEALKALDRLCNMASGQAGQDFSCAKVDYWTVKDAINNKWQPIETAPMDGTEILVPGGIAYYRIVDSGWYTITAEKWPGKPIQWPVKHWMPLPAPPGEDE